MEQGVRETIKEGLRYILIIMTMFIICILTWFFE